VGCGVDGHLAIVRLAFGEWPSDLAVEFIAVLLLNFLLDLFL
jgi:hypothetical protein